MRYAAGSKKHQINTLSGLSLGGHSENQYNGKNAAAQNDNP